MLGSTGAVGQLSGVPAVVGVVMVVVAAATVYSAIEVVEAYEKRALTVLGEYRTLLEPGINFVPPFVSRTYPIDVRTRTLDVPPEGATTRDGSDVTVDAVVDVKVVDAERAFLEVDDHGRAVSNLTRTTIRRVVEGMDLDDVQAAPREVGTRLREELDEPTDEWGIRVESVEIREVDTADRDPGVSHAERGEEETER